MSVRFACLAGRPLCRAMGAGLIVGRELPQAKTPFGPAEPIFLVEDAPVPFYVVPRQSPAPRRSPSQINCRSTLYALKDLGAEAVLSWSAAGAVAHHYRIAQIMVPEDVLDLTTRRATTFFDRSGLGLLRQFPVFCPTLRRALERSGAEVGLDLHSGGTVAITEGPRLETPAEVRMLAGFGADAVTHGLSPEVFLAKELQLCLCGACYLTNYAETGSRHRPLTTGALFGGLTTASQAERLRAVCKALPGLLRHLAEHLADTECQCECPQTMTGHVKNFSLPDDWHEWFA